MKKQTFKKVLAAAMSVAVLGTCAAVTSFAAEPKEVSESTPTFALSSATAKAGEEVTVELTCSNNPGIAGWQNEVKYDSTALELVKADANGVFSSAVSAQDLTKNPITSAWVNMSSNVDSNGTMVTFTFKVKDDAKDGDYTLSLSCEDDWVYSIGDDGTESNVKVNTVDGTITVKSEEEPATTKPVDNKEVTFALSSATAKAGEEVTVELTCSNNPGIAGWQNEVKYDSTALELVKADANGVFSSAVSAQDLTKNPITSAWVNMSSNVDSNGTMVTFTFKVKDDAKDGDYTLSLSCEDDWVYSIGDDGTESNVKVNTVDGTITVKSEEEPTTTPPVTGGVDKTLTGVKMSESELSLKVGETAELSATAEFITNEYPEGEMIIDFAAPQFTTSYENVVALEVTGQGLGVGKVKLTAKAEGTATITATLGEFSATCKVTVTNDEYVKVTPDKLTLKVGETSQLKGDYKLNSVAGEATADMVSPVWSSSNEKVATVDKTGLVAAKAAGKATITYTVGSLKATCEVTVVTSADKDSSDNNGKSAGSGSSGTSTVVNTSAVQTGSAASAFAIFFVLASAVAGMVAYRRKFK